MLNTYQDNNENESLLQKRKERKPLVLCTKLLKIKSN